MRNFCSAVVMAWAFAVFPNGPAQAQTQAQTQGQALAPLPGRIIVQGQGVVETVPDMATINLGVTTQARTAAAAMTANSEASAKVLETIRSAGVARRDMQTSGLSLSVQWSNRSNDNNARPTIVGYVANNQVTVRVRDLAKLGAILDRVIADGATQFHGLVFGLQDPRPAMETARRRAVADAAQRARLYADAADVSLGDLLELRENGGGNGPQFAVREMAMASPVPIAEGEVSVTASVHMEYAIAP